MPDDPNPPVLEYRNLTATPEPRFRWRLYFLGVVTAVASPIFCGVLAAAFSEAFRNDTGGYVAFGICAIGVVAPIIAGIEGLCRKRRRAYGLGVFTVFGMALLGLGTCFMLFK